MEWAGENAALFSDSVLNVTGGTKPMAIAAQEVFRMEERPVLYVDIATDTVSWVSGSRENVALSNQPNLTQFFGLNGISIESGDFKSVVDNEMWRQFYGEIVADPRKWALPIRALNGIAAYAEQEGTKDFAVSDSTLALPSWSEMAKLLHACELVEYKGAGLREAFVSSAARRFCNGIWLEHYVFQMLKSFGFRKSQALMNVKIRDAKGNENELDAVVLHKNTCYVIEDKTKNMRGANIADSAVYKLAQLTSKMGLRTKGVLVSALEVRTVDKDRAAVYNVEVIDWLPALESSLKRIFGIS